MELPSEHDAKQRGATNEPKASESELPSELWLIIMRSLDSMRDHNAMARTCLLFAALARGERERAKLRLARLSAHVRTLNWNNGDPTLSCSYTVVGPFLANGQMHGRCCAYADSHSGGTLICFEAYDDKRQGEAHIWAGETVKLNEALMLSWANAAGRFDQEVERSWYGQPFCDELFLHSRCHYVNDKLEGKSYKYDWLEYKEWYSADMASPLWSLDWRAEPPYKQRAFGGRLEYYEDDWREDYIYYLWADAVVVKGHRAERGVEQSIDSAEYGRGGFAAGFVYVEDGEAQGMTISCGYWGAWGRTAYEEHGVSEGWDIIYNPHGGVETAHYYEDGQSEGHGYFWPLNSRTAIVSDFRRGVKRR